MKKCIILLFSFFFTIIQGFAFETGFLPAQLGVVENVEFIDINDDTTQVKQLVDIKLLQGENKNKLVQVDNMLSGNPYYDIPLKKGKKVLLHLEENEGEITYSIQDVYRSNSLYVLSIIFCLLLIYVGKKKGLYSLLAIVLTCILIVKLLSPMILIGMNPVFSTLIICLLSTMITMYFVGGFNKKSTSAVLGSTLSLIIASFLSVLTVKFATLTGYSNEYSLFLSAAKPQLDFKSLAVATMILATLGAVMDVAMSIASTINEIYCVDNTKTVKELFTCGMNVGRDIIGTMANTLILVYMGASLPLLLLLSNIDLQKFINLNQVVTEIAAALIGSSAIIICVPMTAIVASHLVKKTFIHKEELHF